MTDLYLKIGGLVVGLLLILSNFVNIQSLVSKLVLRKKKILDNTTVTVTTNSDKETGFLEIVSLWYQLKQKCDSFKLTVASEKLDEVFPLLNKVLEDEAA